MLRSPLSRRVFALLALLALPGNAAAQATPPEPPQGDDAPSGRAVPSGASGAAIVPGKPAPARGGPAITPPRLVQFHEAKYPADAEAQQQEGQVVLQLDIDRAGRVTAVVVIQPAGHGFDEAAAEAGKQLVFEPARRGDDPVPSRILYRYSFGLRPKEVPVEQPGAPPPPAEGLKGSVRMAGGEVPLAGAVVRVKGPAGGEITVTTGNEGAWASSDLGAGRYHVTVTVPGYQPLEVDEDVVAGSETEVVYRLVPSETGLEVTVRGERPPREVTRRTLERREIERIPGTNGDALKSIQSLPGVARPPGIGGLLIVRGSSPQDTQVFVDGTYVPIIYHFGGLSSVVPTEMLERIDFYPGNFSAQFGRAMGGIVDVGLRSANPDGKYHGMAQLDLIDMRAMAEGPVPLVKGWSFEAAVRRSWVDVWLRPVLERTANVTAAPVYYDGQVLVETRPTARSSLRFAFFGSDDRIEILNVDPNSRGGAGGGGSLGFHSAFWRLQARYVNEISESLRLTSTTAYGNDSQDFDFGTIYRVRNTWPLSNRTELSYKMGPGVLLHGGADLLYATGTIESRLPPARRAGEPDPGPFASRPPQTSSTSSAVWRPGAYVEAELSPSARAKLVPGVRVDYSKDTGHWDLSPRVNGRYDLVHGFPRTTVKGGVGLFHQPPTVDETNPDIGTPGLLSNRAVHYSVGGEQELTRHVEASLEGFYKQMDQLVTRDPGSAGGFDYTNLGRGYVVGSELLVKYKPDSRFFGWLAYTLSRSVRQDPPDYATRLFQYDQTHILTVLGSYRLGHGWEFGARFRLISGNLYTPVNRGIFSADAGSYGPLNGAVYSERLPYFHQLDVRVDKEWRFEDFRLRAYLDLQNVYNRQNPEMVSYNYDYSQHAIVGLLPIIPSIGLRAEF